MLDVWNAYPVEGLPPQLHFEQFSHSSDGKIHIVLRAPSAVVPHELGDILYEITFDGAFAYRFADEGALLRTLNRQQNMVRSVLFTVPDSSYLAWFHEESYETRRNFEIVHYMVVTPNEVFEILSGDVPVVTSRASHVGRISGA